MKSLFKVAFVCLVASVLVFAQQGPPAANNNISGVIAVTASTTGTFTFANGGWTNTPTCNITPIGDPTAVGIYWATATKTVLTVHVKTSGTFSFNYICRKQPN